MTGCSAPIGRRIPGREMSTRLVALSRSHCGRGSDMRSFDQSPPTRPFNSLTRFPTSRFASFGAPFNQRSLICVRIPFLRPSSDHETLLNSIVADRRPFADRTQTMHPSQLFPAPPPNNPSTWKRCTPFCSRIFRICHSEPRKRRGTCCSLTTSRKADSSLALSARCAAASGSE